MARTDEFHRLCTDYYEGENCPNVMGGKGGGFSEVEEFIQYVQSESTARTSRIWHKAQKDLQEYYETEVNGLEGFGLFSSLCPSSLRVAAELIAGKDPKEISGVELRGLARIEVLARHTSDEVNERRPRDHLRRTMMPFGKPVVIPAACLRRIPPELVKLEAKQLWDRCGKGSAYLAGLKDEAEKGLIALKKLRTSIDIFDQSEAASQRLSAVMDAKPEAMAQAMGMMAMPPKMIEQLQSNASESMKGLGLNLFAWQLPVIALRHSTSVCTTLSLKRREKRR